MRQRMNFVNYSQMFFATACEECCQRRCTKHASLIWMNWNSDWEWNGPSWITSSLRQPFVSFVVDSCRSRKRFYTPLVQYSHTRLWTGFKSGDFGGHSWGWINCGVSLSNNAIVPRARWAFQVSQGSVETLYLSLIHIWRCRRSTLCRSRWSPYH